MAIVQLDSVLKIDGNNAKVIELRNKYAQLLSNQKEEELKAKVKAEAEAKSRADAQVKAEHKSADADAQNKSITVYITNTGKKYHTGGCRYLSKSKIAISLKNAKVGYDPCSVCNPPE